MEICPHSATAVGNSSHTMDVVIRSVRNSNFLGPRSEILQLIPSTNSKRMYDLVSHALKLPSLDDFYRLFLIPGMGHCAGGLGSPSFGQGTLESGPRLVNSSSHNILLALVDWVERGVAPQTIIGSGTNNATRTHCRYPMRSMFNGSEFVCVH